MSTFTSDSETAVEALVAQCNRPRASLEAPSLPHLIGRELQPYDFGGEPAPAVGKPSSGGKRSASSSTQAPRKGSPTNSNSDPSTRKQQQGKKQQATNNKGSSGSNSSGSEDERRPRTSPSPASSSRPIHIRSTALPTTPPPHSSSNSGMQLAFSCPGTFRNSPKPDALPLPSGLLLRAAARASVAVAVPAA